MKTWTKVSDSLPENGECVILLVEIDGTYQKRGIYHEQHIGFIIPNTKSQWIIGGLFGHEVGKVLEWRELEQHTVYKIKNKNERIKKFKP